VKSQPVEGGGAGAGTADAGAAGSSERGPGAAGAAAEGGAGGNATAHCNNQRHDTTESGVDCGGDDCAPCAPCSGTLPYNSEFLADVSYEIETWQDKTCAQSLASTRKSSIVKIGASGAELTVDGLAVPSYQGSDTQGSVTTFFYGVPFGMEDIGCPFIGWLDHPTSTTLSLEVSVDASTGQMRISQTCNDWDGHCLSIKRGYQNSTLDGDASNVCH
jgi:hypothetical protein